MKGFDREIVEGSIFRSVWKLAWPLVLLNLVNGMHALVDHILVGHFVPSEDNAANAAIGIAWQVFLVVVVFIASLFHGMNVLIAQSAGREDRENMGRVFQASFQSAVMILAIMAPVGFFLAPYLLDFVGAEPGVRQHALPYLRILFTSGAPLFLMFMLTGAFQASGEPKTPLKLGILTTVLNIVFSAALIIGVGPIPALGTIGAALGTVLAPMTSVVIALYLIFRRKALIPPPKRLRLLPDFSVMKPVARIGIPTGIQGVLLNVAGVFLLRFIASLENSAAAQAAYTICYAQLFMVITWTSFGLRAAAATIMGQNIGAGKPKRGKNGVAVAAGMGAAWAMTVGLLYWFFPKPLLALFDATGEPLFSFGQSLLHYLAFSGIALASTLALTGGLQGAGETKVPMYIAFLTQIVVLLGICFGFQAAGRLSTDIIWAAILVSHTLRFAFTLAFFRTKSWAHKKIEIQE